jgi:hypothetical protein
MTVIRGKSLIAVCRDIADGYVVVNPLFLKPLDNETIEGLYHQIMKIQVEVRGEKFPHGDISGIRTRNVRLQRLHTSLMIIRNYAKGRGMRHLF